MLDFEIVPPTEKQKGQDWRPGPLNDLATYENTVISHTIAESPEKYNWRLGMSNNGFIQIPRSLYEHPTFVNAPPTQKWLLFCILERMCFLPCQQDDHGRIINLLPGEYMTSERHLAEWAGLSKNDVHRGLERFEKAGIIKTRSSKSEPGGSEKVNHKVNQAKTIITLTYLPICNLIKRYSEPTSEPSLNQDRTIIEPQKDKEIKKERDKEYIEIDKSISCSEPDESSSKPAKPKKPKKEKKEDPLKFDWEKGEFVGITPTDIENWKAAYPGVDIQLQLAKKKVWVLANTSKTTNRTLWRKSIATWLGIAYQQAAKNEMYKANKPQNTIEGRKETFRQQYKTGQTQHGTHVEINEKGWAFTRGRKHHQAAWDDFNFDYKYQNAINDLGVI